MTKPNQNTDRFFENSDLNPEKLKKLIQEGLQGTDFGEFYQEMKASESIVKDKGQMRLSVGNLSSGFSFRAGQEDRTGFSFGEDFNSQVLKGAIQASRNVLKGRDGKKHFESKAVPQLLFPSQNPLETMDLLQKIKKIDEIEAYAKSLDPSIRNVTVAYVAEHKAVQIVTSEGETMVDDRPLVRLDVAITVEDANGKTQTAGSSLGGRMLTKDLLDNMDYQQAAKQALSNAKTLLIADEIESGQMDIVLAPGWQGVLLHEAVGHGLEGDFNRENQSVYSGKVGQKIATDQVTIVDQGDLGGAYRGSLHFDDEGTKTQRNVLVKDGVLQGYMQDRMNARLMGVAPTGNGRRESYAHAPMPRMTNTYFENGNIDPEDIIKSVKNGLFINSMGGGQVDIVSGKFNMNAKLAYIIRDGKICEPVKGAALVGDGLTVIKNIDMIGNDLGIETSAGTCGKAGQSVPAGIGQPTVKVRKMTVGGTK
ncbi:MAG: metalloprotease TldD [Rickettsiales bacterium]|nr:metalloprotease TldD [Rickettsiales bacterium]